MYDLSHTNGVTPEDPPASLDPCRSHQWYVNTVLLRIDHTDSALEQPLEINQSRCKPAA